MIAKLWRVLRRCGAAGPKTVFLHVGAGKTGTSAIQTWLARNLRRLEEHGIAYPEPPEGFDLAVEGKSRIQPDLELQRALIDLSRED